MAGTAMALYQHVKALIPSLLLHGSPITVHIAFEEVGPWAVFVYIAIKEL